MNSPLTWAAIPCITTLLALSQGFSNTRVFFVRDLGSQYLPTHRWLRSALWNGEFPMWDPYCAFGQPAIADPARQMLFLPTLVLRFLPENLGFNLICLLPFPIASVGAFLFLRRHVSDRAASLGAGVFSLSGILLSIANFPNMSWVCCFIPFVFWAIDRCARTRTLGSMGLLGVFFGLQAMAGEAVGLLGTAALAVLYAGFGQEGSWRDRAEAIARTIGGGILGILLAAVQLFPLLEAASNSPRSGPISIRAQSLWPIHPLALAEFTTPNLFGDYFTGGWNTTPWIFALNTQLEPCLFSTYVGVAAIGFAILGAIASGAPQSRRFWTVVLAGTLVLALGEHTPVYPFFRDALPVLKVVRFPAKFLVFFAFALGVLAAFGWDSLKDVHTNAARARQVRVVCWILGVFAAVWSVMWLLPALAPDFTHQTLGRLAASVAIADADTDTAAKFLANSLAASAPRVLYLTVTVVVFLAIGASDRREASLAKVVLFATALLDPAMTNNAVNPVMDATLLSAPGWLARVQENPQDRVYVGSRTPKLYDYDNPNLYTGAVDYTHIENQAIFAATHVPFPAYGRLREAISHDYTALWPLAYHAFQGRFGAADRENRRRALRNTGVRYFAIVPPPPDNATELERLRDGLGFALYDAGPPAAPRAYVVPLAEVVPDRDARIARLFDADFDPRAAVLIEEVQPEIAGSSGAPEAAGAEMLVDTGSEIRIQAAVPAGGGYLVLQDSYAPGWKAEVDGIPARIERANGLFRCVRLAQGKHEVVFRFRPDSVRFGGWVSATAMLALLVFFVIDWRRSRKSPDGQDRPIPSN